MTHVNHRPMVVPESTPESDMAKNPQVGIRENKQGMSLSVAGSGGRGPGSSDTGVFTGNLGSVLGRLVPVTVEKDAGTSGSTTGVRGTIGGGNGEGSNDILLSSSKCPMSTPQSRRRGRQAGDQLRQCSQHCQGLSHSTLT